jgi:hypothetical protein
VHGRVCAAVAGQGRLSGRGEHALLTAVLLGWLAAPPGRTMGPRARLTAEYNLSECLITCGCLVLAVENKPDVCQELIRHWAASDEQVSQLRRLVYGTAPLVYGTAPQHTQSPRRRLLLVQIGMLAAAS